MRILSHFRKKRGNMPTPEPNRTHSHPRARRNPTAIRRRKRLRRMSPPDCRSQVQTSCPRRSRTTFPTRLRLRCRRRLVRSEPTIGDLGPPRFSRATRRRERGQRRGRVLSLDRIADGERVQRPMRVLILYANPVAASFGAALHNEVVTTLSSRGHEIDDCDLYAESFDPVMSEEERIRYHDTTANRTPVVGLCRSVACGRSARPRLSRLERGIPGDSQGLFRSRLHSRSEFQNWPGRRPRRRAWET